jgi:hypothetical protein
MATEFRATAPSAAVAHPLLGPLAELPGSTWVGKGFNLISLPDKEENKPFRLKLNATVENLTFTPIGGPIPNRGSGQKDIEFLGLHYLQLINDARDNGALHLEPGIWLNVGPTDDPKAGPSVVRMATIPHGDSLLAQGPLINDGKPFPGGPKIEVVDSTPFTLDPATGARKNDNNAQYLAPFHDANLRPPGITEAMVANPNLVLTDAIKGQKIVETIVLSISATPVGGINGTPISPPNKPSQVGGIVNIPFVVKNANANAFSAIFWIETVEHPNGYRYLQLQYTQTVILDFIGLKWPHISVATLVKR